MKKILALVLALSLPALVGCELFAPANIQSKAPFDTLECVVGEPSLVAPAGFPEEEIYEAEFLGASDEDIYKYDFVIKEREETFTLLETKDHALQNKLKRGHRYRITVKNGTVIDASAKNTHTDNFTPVVSGVAGQATLKNLIATALAPVGSTLYVYGGGWNWQDDGASDEAKSIGLSPDWRDFFCLHNDTYSYMDGYFPHRGINEYRFAGLDCSGYLGWVIYNVANASEGGNGFVVGSTYFAKNLSDMGYGTMSKDISALSVGDIVSIGGHVWLCVGVCDDGSALIAHSTPSRSRSGAEGGGVQLSALGYSTDCKAYLLADETMKKYYPQWYERYNTELFSLEYYSDFATSDTGIFSWNDTLGDPDGFSDMSPKEILDVFYVG